MFAKILAILAIPAAALTMTAGAASASTIPVPKPLPVTVVRPVLPIAPIAPIAHPAPPVLHQRPCPPLTYVTYRYLPESLTLTPAGHGMFKAVMSGPVGGTGKAKAAGGGYLITAGYSVIRVNLFAQGHGWGQFTLRAQPGDRQANGTYWTGRNGVLHLDGTARVAVVHVLPWRFFPPRGCHL